MAEKKNNFFVLRSIFAIFAPETDKRLIDMKRFVYTMFLAGFLVAVKAQKMEDFFIQMPDNLIIQLEEAWRKDLVGLYKSGKPAVLENMMAGKSVLNKLTDDYLLLQSTESSTVELKLLSLINNSLIICMIETVYAPVADSRVSFYTTDWHLLPTEDLLTPVTVEWFWKEDIDQTEIAYLSRSELFLVKYSLSVDDVILTAEYTTPRYLDDENQQIVKPLLKAEPKIYSWKSGRFE